MNCFLLIWLISDLNSLELSRKNASLFLREKAEEEYKWDISLQIHGAPSPICPNLPISFCSSLTLKIFLFGCHLHFNNSRTCLRYSSLIPTVYLSQQPGLGLSGATLGLVRAIFRGTTGIVKHRCQVRRYAADCKYCLHCCREWFNYPMPCDSSLHDVVNIDFGCWWNDDWWGYPAHPKHHSLCYMILLGLDPASWLHPASLACQCISYVWWSGCPLRKRLVSGS